MAKLICSFTNKNGIFNFIKNVNDEFGIKDFKIDLFNVESEGDYICLYEIQQVQPSLPKRSFLVHKKSQSNTIYTINALNLIIRNINNGILSKDVDINWDVYTNTLLISNQDSLIKKKIKYKETIR